MLSAVFRCEACGWQTICGKVEIARRLRVLGLLRRAPHPPEELIRELLAVHTGRLACDPCGHLGLVWAEGDLEDSSNEDWQQAVLCEACRQPIPPERLEIFPNAKRCVECQGISDRGEEVDEPDFCPRCGSLLELRMSRGSGITRYKQFCTGDPACRL